MNRLVVMVLMVLVVFAVVAVTLQIRETRKPLSKVVGELPKD